MSAKKPHGKIRQAEKYTADDMRKAVKSYISLVNASAVLKLGFEHYTFTEEHIEGLNAFFSEADPEIREFEKLLGEVYEVHNYGPDILDRIESLRRTIIRETHVITGYADRFAIFEYVLNRLEYNFKDYDPKDESEVVRALLDYIFETDDNMIVNTRIISVIGQLPVRMTKGRLCDLVRDACRVYKGSEKTSFADFADNIREAAGLSPVSDEFASLNKFGEELKSFEEYSFEHCDKENYEGFTDRLETVTNELKSLSDICTELISMVNSLYITVLSAPHAVLVNLDDPSVVLVRAGYSLYNGNDSDVWTRYLKPASDSVQDRLESLDDVFMAVEGRQEAIGQRSEALYSILDTMIASQRDEFTAAFTFTDEDGTEFRGEDVILTIDRLSKLASSSEFMSLEKDDEITIGNHKKEENDPDLADEKIADSDYIEHEADLLVKELKDRMSEVERPVRRAIMSSVLERLPVFFREAKEIADYIQDSLKYCDNENEKQACMNMLMMLTES
jgi:hypothetical protein